MTVTDGMNGRQWCRLDTGMLLLLLLTAAVLRLVAYGRLGIDHFDEGGYAMSAMAVFEWRDALLYPLQHLLSPPLYFSLAGLVMHIAGSPTDQALFAVSLITGSLTVLAVFMLARNSYGREAGFAAGLLVALADYHIAFSRAGLTDVTFCFFFLLALMGYARAEQRESYVWAVIAGILTGLAWNTKYHGWLAGVVAGAALLPYLLHDWPRFRAGFLRILVAAATATVMYIPWVLYVEAQSGGYAYLAEYQSGYLRPAEIPQNILSHIRAQYNLDGWSGMLAPMLAALSVAMLYRRLDGAALVLSLILLLAGVALGESVTVVLLALAGLVVLVRNNPGYDQWLLVAFLVVFSLMSPFYTPYARLLLPLMCSAYLLAGVGVVGLVRDGGSRSSCSLSGCRLLCSAVVSLSLLALIVIAGTPERGHTYRDRTGFRTAVSGLVPLLADRLPVAVIGEPAVVFYLRARGFTAVHLDTIDDVHDYYSPGTPVYLVCGRYACYRSGDWSEKYPGAITGIGSVAVDDISDVRLFDDESPWSAVHWEKGVRRDYDLRLYRFDVPAPAPRSRQSG